MKGFSALAMRHRPLGSLLSRSVQRCDLLLIIPTGLVLAFGLLGLYSVNPALARAQVLFALFGGLGFVLVSILSYRRLKTAALPVFLISSVLLLGVLFLGKEVGGASRWFAIGPLFFSPSEFAKVALIVVVSSLLSSSPSLGVRGFLISIVPVAILSVMAVLQPSLGTALVFCVVWAGIIWAAGVPIRYLFTCLVLIGVSLPLVWGGLEGYQRARITAFLNPMSDPLGSGYNVIQSVIAVGSGQLLGKGLGMGTQSRLQFLPVRYTDFIFASLTEEWGLLGAGLLLALFGILLWRILKITSFCRDRFGFLLGSGVFTLFFAQVVINVGMNIGAAPITGLSLPLVSYGGSSLLFTLAALGLVHSLAIHRDGQSFGVPRS